MKDKIPTVKHTVKVGEESVEIEVYEWITQDEEDDLSNAMLGGNDGYTADEFQTATFKIRPENMKEYNKRTLIAYLKTPTYDEYNLMKPVLREAIYKVVDSVVKDGKKK